MKINKIIAGSVTFAMLALAMPAFAQYGSTSTTTANTDLVNQISSLLAQVKTLQDQLATINGQRASTTLAIMTNLKLARSLSLGMSGDDVKLLQQILATDPSIYPEGIISGYFGSLTQKAVERWQEKEGIEKVGRVGPKSLARLNQLLSEGAGNSGNIPPGLLIAPGQAKKLGTSTVNTLSTSTLANLCQTLPPGIAKKVTICGPISVVPSPTSTPTTTDATAPTINDVLTSSAGTNSAIIVWSTNENANSRVWFGTSTPVGTSNATLQFDNSLSMAHNITISGLQASTTYYYVVSSSDSSGNSATSSEKSFATAH